MTQVYIAIDGDDVGRAIEGYLLCNDVQDALDLSRQVERELSNLAECLRAQGFEVFFASGDSLLAAGAALTAAWLASRMAESEFAFSAGMGQSAALAHLALRAAKTQGKRRVVQCLLDEAGLLNGDILRFKTALID